ncbi:MAG TPA: hypothetical protein DEB39_01630 [Planctomycetaceae bacterium]|nr:hypothetical protein [Planctomycetaceae bacterium]
MASGNGTLLLWDIGNGKILREIKAHEMENGCAKFSPDGSFVATASQDTTASIWNTTTGKEIRRFRGHTDTIVDIALSPDGKLLATASDNKDGSVRIWDIESGKELFRLYVPTNDPCGLAFNHKGTIIAVADPSAVNLWDVKTGQPVKRFFGSYASAIALGFSPDDSQLAFGCHVGYHSAVWDVESGMPLYRLPTGGCWWTETVTFSKDGKMIATVGDGPIIIWEVPTSAELTRLEQELKAKRETGKEILLKEMPPPACFGFGYGYWHWWTLETEQTKYENTLSAIAYSRYVFQLEKQWKTFKTQYCLNECNLAEAGCVFIVKGDDKELFRSAVVQWLVRLSRRVGKNLGPYFDRWGVPVSQSAKDTIKGFPVWLPY